MYRGTDCCLLVFDCTDITTFTALESWKSRFLSADPSLVDVPFLVLGFCFFF